MVLIATVSSNCFFPLLFWSATAVLKGEHAYEQEPVYVLEGQGVRKVLRGQM